MQSDLLSHLNTRAVVLLLPLSIAPLPIRDLSPVLSVREEPHVLLPQLTAVPARELRGCATSLASDHDAVVRALDILLIGY